MLEFLTNNLWVIAAAIAGFTTILTEAINQKLKPNGVWKQVISWVVSIALTVVAFFAGTYEFPGTPWVSVPLVGIAVGLTSNGFYDIPKIKEYVKLFIGFFYKKD